MKVVLKASVFAAMAAVSVRSQMLLDNLDVSVKEERRLTSGQELLDLKADVASPWQQNRQDLTKNEQKWRLRCVTDDVDPIDSMEGDKKIKRDYMRMRDFERKQGMCAEY